MALVMSSFERSLGWGTPFVQPEHRAHRLKWLEMGGDCVCERETFSGFWFRFSPLLLSFVGEMAMEILPVRWKKTYTWRKGPGFDRLHGVKKTSSLFVFVFDFFCAKFSTVCDVWSLFFGLVWFHGL